MAALESPEAKKDRIRRAAADSHRTHATLKKCLDWLRTRAAVRKGSRKLRRMVHEKCLRPRFGRWVAATEDYLSHVLQQRKRTVSSLLARAFDGWKREILVKKLARLFRTRKLLLAWNTAVSAQVRARPQGVRKILLGRRTFLGFRIRMKQLLEKRRCEIVGREVLSRHEDALKKLSFVRLMEWVMRQKKYDWK